MVQNQNGKVGYFQVGEFVGAFQETRYKRIVVVDEYTSYTAQSGDYVWRISAGNIPSCYGQDALFFEDGHITDGFCEWMPAKFWKNRWSSNSYDQGGFVVDGKAFNTAENMIDQDNETWNASNWGGNTY